MVREKLESCGLDVGLEAVELNAILVIDEDVFFLRNGEVRLVVEESGHNVITGIMVDGLMQYLRDVPTCLL